MKNFAASRPSISAFTSKNSAFGVLAKASGWCSTRTVSGESWYLSAAAPEDKDLLCQEVTFLAGKPVEEVIEAYGTLFASDNPVHLRRSFRQAYPPPLFRRSRRTRL